MELITGATLSLFVVSAVLILVLTLLISRQLAPPGSKKKRRQPPGPWRLPLIGNLHQIMTSKLPVVLRDLARKHGPVMYLRLGQVDAVVVSSPAAAREVLRDKDAAFASRPRVLMSEISLYGNLDMAFAPYGAYWRALRKICAAELLSERKVRQFWAVRDGETMSLVAGVGEASRGGKPFSLRRLLVLCSNSITAKTAFGEVCSSELQEQFLAVMDEVLKLGTGLCVGDLFPSLWFLDVVTGLRGRLWRARRQQDELLDKIISQSEMRPGDHVLGSLLSIRDKGEIDSISVPMELDNVKAIIMDMFTAGTETTSSAAEWVMSDLMRNPEVMIKAQAEVRRTLDGKSSQDHEGHMVDLHYTKMVIKESMRLNPVLPLLIPRVCRETCDVGGFEVTEGTRVMVNAWALGRNPESWHEPEEFRPERFEDGTATYKGSRFDYLPFGSGRRVCPGDTFGVAVLEIMVARLLYYFDWSLPAGAQPRELDMEMVVALTSRRKNPLHLVATPYKACTC
ncbi:Cytochrome P450 99A2 [Hordeum vulgare]|uniref:9-beta-pimara-7,15-diene oxidase-like n=1 Tax=Hordeum vulgare subsp. vulgare TaxID=112509 RepID=UPI000B4657B2|nr:9-beta-pimara-7,15-diene oxidase-like [Hordeum vulgare subsp. vulgare]KAE8777500.1 Cytochrome P450 99A2 [Hordeum vulgare]